MSPARRQQPALLVDTHCHLDQYHDPEGVVRSLDRSNVAVVAVTVAPSVFERLRRRFGNERRVRIAIGAHPLHVAAFPPVEWRLFDQLVQDSSYVGEVGLDFSSRGFSTRTEQERALRRVLGAIRGRNKIVTIHSRRAETAVLDLLQQYEVSPCIFHWFSGPSNVLGRLLADQHFCSINPAMVASPGGRRTIEQVPPDRLLLETDGPFVRIHGRPAEPLDIHTVAGHLANVWGVPIESVHEQIHTNWLRLAVRQGDSPSHS